MMFLPYSHKVPFRELFNGLKTQVNNSLKCSIKQDLVNLKNDYNI